MRVMVLVKATTESEAGGCRHDEPRQRRRPAGGRRAPAERVGVRVRFDGPKRTVIDGPFTEAKELVAGYWIWEVRSVDEAVEWLKRAPFDGGTEIEIRPVFEADDFGAESFTPELQDREHRQRRRCAARRSPGRPTAERAR